METPLISEQRDGEEEGEMEGLPRQAWDVLLGEGIAQGSPYCSDRRPQAGQAVTRASAHALGLGKFKVDRGHRVLVVWLRDMEERGRKDLPFVAKSLL